ncbi:MAG: hypothetical protein AAF193_08530, partial [Bacteroidota bacterium]
MRVLLTFLALTIASTTFCQDFQDPNNDPDWSALMQDPNVNFEEVKALFNEAWVNREVTKGCGYKPFKRWEMLMESRVKENGEIPTGQEMLKAQFHLDQQKSLAGNWSPLGPILDDVTTRDDIRGVGRMNYVAFHPTDPMVVFAGAPSGGLWRSYDGGYHWESNTDDLPTLGVSSIGFDPSNPDIVYIGTGDRDANDSPGMGVFKSLDGGITWTPSNNGIENLTVGDLAIDPNDTNILIAATSSGMYRSEDAGESWSLESPNLNFKEVEFKPGDSEVVYATG